MVETRGPRDGLIRRGWWRLGATVVVVSALAHLEAWRVARSAGAELAGGWEELLLLRGVPAAATICALPIAVVWTAFSTLLPIARRASGRRAWAASVGLVAGALSIALSTGRKA